MIKTLILIFTLALTSCNGNRPVPKPPAPSVLRDYRPVQNNITPPDVFEDFVLWFWQHEQVDFTETLDSNKAVDPVLLWGSFERARQLINTVFPNVPRYPMSVFDWDYLLSEDPWANPNIYLDEAPAAIVEANGVVDSFQGVFQFSRADPPRRVPEIRYAHERAVFCEALHGILWIAWQEGRIGPQHFAPAGHNEPGDPFVFDCAALTNQEWLDSGVSAVPPLPDRWPW